MGCRVRFVLVRGISHKRHLKAPVSPSPPTALAVYSVPLARQRRAQPCRLSKKCANQWLTQVAGSRTWQLMRRSVGWAHTIMKSEIERRRHRRATKSVVRFAAACAALTFMVGLGMPAAKADTTYYYT